MTINRFFMLISFFVLIAFACHGGQSANEKEVSQRVAQLMDAMVSRSHRQLSDLTAEQLIYGHSGGKVQDKEAFIAEILSGEPLQYLSIELLDQSISVVDNIAIVRHIFTAQTSANGKSGALRIGNVLVWQLQEGSWKLLLRQAYKLPEP
ncbi:hypothetical protein M2459_001554 [Parabacteroides sp. PF5-5]|nr:hypothetical protein [Parabacteroides sp. PF5-13]MDH6326761.1 hypothetical protein [Parabacteroides sp. PH5-41]MDH6334810.1 hypothetical protein [Parabacteroides sp. PF5-5]MDH6345874.1 hypothetical protein [Parabacteroides sp. PH5-46]MDH6360830.1 hypothetical protein [Parabacteroides sp. PH5-16]MDH6376248.1 hypothetical protein [Parabacteroides sp. PH5-33]